MESDNEIGRTIVMTRHLLATAVAVGALAISIVSINPAHALSMSECSAKYKASKDAGTLNGMKWNDFRKAQCGAEATAAPAPAAAAPTAAAPTAPVTNPLKALAPKAAPTAAGSATFPSAISSKYSSEAAGKQRMHTCLDQYNANKTNGGNGGLKWIQKGGGYYSECNKHLKGTG
jgi:hypothetical protein